MLPLELSIGHPSKAGSRHILRVQLGMTIQRGTRFETLSTPPDVGSSFPRPNQLSRPIKLLGASLRTPSQCTRSCCTFGHPSQESRPSHSWSALAPAMEQKLTWKQAYYSHNVGTPCLEYMLCSNAVRLAVAKGLHRQPAGSKSLSEQETNQRSCIFWGAYCLEKQIASQSGRCSVRTMPVH
jgi:hypothetical protein